MIIINIFEPPPPLTIGIIISENVDNYGRPLTFNYHIRLCPAYQGSYVQPVGGPPAH